MVRLLPLLTLMPPLTVRTQLSARIRWTSPVTVTRLLISTLLRTMYQPPVVVSFSSVVLVVTFVMEAGTSALTSSLPFQVRYVSVSSAAAGTHRLTASAAHTLIFIS